MTVQADAEVRRILLRAFPGSHIEACEELKGGVSARAVVVDVALQDATARRVVVRRPSYPTPEEALRAVVSEHALLARCASLGIPAPMPCFLDASEAALVLEYIEGAPEFAPANTGDMVHQMARQLANIHGVGITGELEFLRRRNDTAGWWVRHAPEQLDETLEEARLRAVLTGLWPWRQANADVLLHGDYWPGNLLWRDGQLVAVLDWEEAEIGDPLADVAISRLDLLWAFGEPVMHAFTECYREHTRIDWGNLARWDLFVALRPMSNLARWAESYAHPPICRPDITEPGMRAGHRRFVQQALRALAMDR